jgi:uncharacterized membrane protein
MTLAWFVLMALGVFVGRYYKETAGINPETKNSLLGLGWWIWVMQNKSQVIYHFLI